MGAFCFCFLIRRLHRIYKKNYATPLHADSTMLHITHETAQHTRCTRKIIEIYNRLIESARCHTFPRSTLHHTRPVAHIAAWPSHAAAVHPNLTQPYALATRPRSPAVGSFIDHPILSAANRNPHTIVAPAFGGRPHPPNTHKHTHTHAHTHTQAHAYQPASRTHEHHHWHTHHHPKHPSLTRVTTPNHKSCCVWHVCECVCMPANCTLLLLSV